MSDRFQIVVNEAAQGASSVETSPEFVVSCTGQADVVFAPPLAVVDNPVLIQVSLVKRRLFAQL